MPSKPVPPFKVVVANWFPRTTANERHYGMVSMMVRSCLTRLTRRAFSFGPELLLEQPALMTVD